MVLVAARQTLELLQDNGFGLSKRRAAPTSWGRLEARSGRRKLNASAMELRRTGHVGYRVSGP